MQASTAAGESDGNESAGDRRREPPSRGDSAELLGVDCWFCGRKPAGRATTARVGFFAIGFRIVNEKPVASGGGPRVRLLHGGLSWRIAARGCPSRFAC
jgi:hypothetical protein